MCNSSYKYFIIQKTQFNFKDKKTRNPNPVACRRDLQFGPSGRRETQGNVDGNRTSIKQKDKNSNIASETIAPEGLHRGKKTWNLPTNPWTHSYDSSSTCHIRARIGLFVRWNHKDNQERLIPSVKHDNSMKYYNHQ